MDAVNIMYQSYPTLGDAGFNGYGSWSIYQPPTSTDGSSPIANSTTSYIHTVANFGKTAAEAESLFAPIAAQLAPYNGTNLFMSTSYFESPSYAAYYQRFSGIVTPVGTTAALGSRFLDKKALTEDKAALNAMLKTIAGTPEQATSNNIIFMGGKGSQLYADAKDRNSGVNPAWRSMYVHNIVARGWAPGSDNATIDAVYDDITNVKVQAMKKLAPSTGSYMNEVCGLPRSVSIFLKPLTWCIGRPQRPRVPR